MAEVTDPELLKLLNAPIGAPEHMPGKAAAKEVTDPEILRQLNEPEKEEPSGLMDTLKTLPAAAVRGFAGALSGIGKSQGPISGMTNEEMPGPEETTQALEKNITGPLYQPQTGYGRHIGEPIGEAFGNPASWAGPGGFLAKAAGNVGGALGGEFAGEATKGSAFETPARFLGGLIGGHATTTVPSRIGALTTIEPERQALIDALKKEGVTSLTAGQKLGNVGLKAAEEHLSSTIGGGGGAAKTATEGLGQYTRAVLKRMGEDADRATPEVIESARQRIGDKLDEVAKKLPVKFTKDFGDKLSKIGEDLTNEGLAPEQTNRIMTNLNNVRNAFITKAPQGGLDRTIAEMRASAGTAPPASIEEALKQGVSKINATPTGNPAEGIMPGKAYQMLTRKDTPLDRLINSQNPDERFYGGRIRDALDEAMSKTAAGRGTREGTGRRQALADLLEARRQWRTMVAVSKAVTGPGENAPLGLITPAKLRQAITGTDADKMYFARGKGNLNELTRAGQVEMLPVPNSGTPIRQAAEHMAHIGEHVGLAALLGGEGAAQGASMPEMLGLGLAGAAAPAIAGRMIMSRPVQKYLSNEIPGQIYISENRPGAAPAWLSMVNLLRGKNNEEERRR